MPRTRCLVNDCNWVSDDSAASLVAAQLNSHMFNHNVANAQPQVSHDRTKIEHPKITTGCTPERFSYFKTRWTAYKQITNLHEDSKASHLLQCCEEDLNLALYRAHRDDLLKLNEEQLLKAIEENAVKMEKKIVARVKLLNMQQDRDEDITNFTNRIKGQAGICAFTKKHECKSCKVENDVDYSEDMIQDVIARGLSDPDIQLELLGKPDQDMSLDETIEFIKTKEAGKISASHIATQSASAIKSSHRRMADKKWVQHKPPTASNYHKPAQNYDNTKKLPIPEVFNKDGKPKCFNCGQFGHRGYKSGRCPAFGKTCGKCGIDNHFAHLCFTNKNYGKTRNTTASVDDYQDDILATHEEEGTDPQSVSSTFNYRG